MFRAQRRQLGCTGRACRRSCGNWGFDGRAANRWKRSSSSVVFWLVVSKEILRWDFDDGQDRDKRIRYGWRREHAIWFRQSTSGIKWRNHARAYGPIG